MRLLRACALARFFCSAPKTRFQRCCDFGLREPDVESNFLELTPYLGLLEVAGVEQLA